MKKTSVYLSEAEARRLAELSALERRSQAEIIRAAIGEYLPKGSPDRDFAMARSGRGPGGSVADIPEEELLEGFGE